MNEHKGQIRRLAVDNTPTKSSWEQGRNDFEQGQQDKYSRNRDFDKSELSYYGSQLSHTVYQNEQLGVGNISQRQHSDRLNILNTKNPNNTANDFSEASSLSAYDNVIPIKMQTPDAEEHERDLRIQIRSTVEKGMNKLSLYLIDGRNPKFLWLFSIKENDFMMLKKQQKLRVDFKAFPPMLMDHFSMCKSENQAAKLPKNQCYFYAQFEIKKNNEGSLNILQFNQYKDSIHLTLKCRLANDEEVKQYLSEKLLKIEEENNNLQNIISNLEHSLSVRKQEIERSQIQLRQARKQKQVSQEKFNMRLQQQKTYLNSERAKSQEMIKKELTQQRKQIQTSLEEKLTKTTSMNDDLKQKNIQLHDKLSAIQSKERQASFDLSNMQKQLETYKQRLSEQKQYNSDLQSKSTQDQKTLIEQKVRIESLESQIADKLKIIQSNVELKSTNSHQINSLELKANEYKKQVEKLETKIQSLQSELQKQDNEMKELREKYDKRKDKLTSRNQIIKEQQRVVNEKENQVYDLKRQVQQKQKQLDEATYNNEQKQRKITELKRQIGECQTKIKDNSDLVNHLQKQLNDRAMMRPGYSATLGSNFAPRSTSPFSSNVSGRDYLSSNSTSRLKFTNTVDNPNNEESSERPSASRKQPQIKRYDQSAYRERSRSPVINSRLNQQKDPSEDTFSKTGGIRPVKFKFSQKND